VLDPKLLDDQIQDMTTAGSLPEEPRTLAKVLVRDGLITYFQAEQLMQGRHQGFVINGKYKVLERLGSGGMGTVFLCEHKVMRHRVALKVIRLDKANDVSALQRFFREARAVAAMDHPNIVRAHDVDQDGKLLFLVMAYVDGTSLQRIVNDHGPMDILRAAHYIGQAALGLQHVHESGLVHRDIKPGNLLLDRGGTLKILDLGLARFFHEDDNLTKKHDPQAALGTADYLSPEQALDSHEVDARGDIYSLGATFYFLLTGRAPFQHGNLQEKFLWHQLRQPPPIHDIRPAVPEELIAIINRMMAKESADRYQTSVEVHADLAPWLETPIPPPPEQEMPRFCPALRGSGSGGPTSKVRLGGPQSPGMPSSGKTQASGSIKPPSSKETTRVLSGVTTRSRPRLSSVGVWGRKPVVWIAGSAGLLLLAVALIWWALSGRGPHPSPGIGRNTSNEGLATGIPGDPKLAATLYLDRGRDLARRGADREAVENFTRAVTFQPSNVEAWTARAEIYEKWQQWDKALDDYGKAIELRSYDVDLRLKRSQIYITLEKWQEAVADFTEIVKLRPRDQELWYRKGVLHLAVNDVPAYRGNCERMLEHFGGTSDRGVAERVLYACLPIANAVADPQKLVQLGEVATSQGQGNPRVHGAALYRAGKYQAALAKFDQSHDHRAWDWLFLAMTHHRLGHTNDARQCLDQALQWIRDADAKHGWIAWYEIVEIRYLRREVEALLKR
jgi:serine/threonine protein kinase